MDDPASEGRAPGSPPGWMYPTERARLLRRHADTLERLLLDVARSPHRRDVLPSPTLVVSRFIDALLVRCIQADGHRTGGELALVQEYFRDGADLRDTDDWVRNAGDTDTHLTALRQFLVVANVHDGREGTSLMQQIMFIVGDLAAVIVTSDAHTAAGEGKLVAELLNEIVVPPLDE